MEENKEKNGAKNPMVFYRLRPSKDFSYENIKVQDDFMMVHARRVQDCSPNMFNAPLYLGYKCDAVFYRHPQRIVYGGVMKDVLARVTEGCDATIISYGQTGSGKTHTMTGLRNCFDETGIVPRFLAEMFELQSKQVLDWIIDFRMSFVELIEPTDVRDLLVTAEDKKIAKLKYQDRLKSASRLVIPTEADALRLIFSGERQRKVERTASYPGANLSHTVLTIYIEARSLLKTLPVVNFGKIHFVDMMGTNCAGNAKCHLHPRVQGRANLAKMLLEQYFSHMAVSHTQPISQNWTSIVIDYLGESLNRQAIMRIIGHVHGSASDLEVTHSTLRFGAVMAAMRPVGLARHVGPDSVQQQINDQEELECLNQHRLMIESWDKELHLNHGEERLSNGRVAHLRRLVPHFLLGKVPVEVVIALNQMPLFMQLCKEHVASMKRESQENVVFLEALRKEEDAALLEKVMMAEMDSLGSRTRSSLKGLGTKSQESQKSIRATSKEGGSSKSKGGKFLHSSEKVKRGASETSKKSKSSSRNTRASFAESLSKEILAETEFPVRHVPSRSAGWAMFMVGPTARELQEVVKEAEIADKLKNEEYEKTKVGVMEASQNLEEARKELYLAQKLRLLKSEETFTAREKMLNELFEEKEKEFKEILDAMHMQKLLKYETAKRLTAARRKIETNYQAFCVANYGVPTPDSGLEHCDDDVCVKADKSFEISYNKMQNSILLHSNTSTDKKRRKQSFYSDKCFSEDLPFQN